MRRDWLELTDGAGDFFKRSYRLAHSVFFDPGQATLKQSAKASLDKVVVALKRQFAGKRVETRLLMHHADGDWGGYSYEWLDDQSEGYAETAAFLDRRIDDVMKIAVAQDGRYKGQLLKAGTYKVAVETKGVQIRAKYSDPDKSGLTYTVAPSWSRR